MQDCETPLRLGDAGASGSFQKAIAAYPDYADAFRARGKVLEQLSDLEGAKYHYLEATRRGKGRAGSVL